MSCWHRTVVLRIPASALGFQYLHEWTEFLKKHEDDFEWEEGCFCDALCDDFPSVFDWGSIEFTDPDWRLDQRDPEHPDIIPGPFLDYYLTDEYPLKPEFNRYGADNAAFALDETEMKEYLPEYQTLFPHFTLKNMEAVRKCDFEWYDGSGASYLYSDYDEGEVQ